MIRATRFLVASFFMLALAALANAQVPILYYDFENNATRGTSENVVEQAVNAGSGPVTVTTPAAAESIAGVAGAGRYRNNDVTAITGGALSTNASPNWASSVTADPGNAATAYYEFVVNTTGFSGMSIEFDSRVSSTGPARVGILYSTDGVNFTSAGVTQNTGFSATAPTDITSWTTNIFDLSSVSAIDNQTSVTIRIYAYAGSAAERTANNSMGTAGTGGTFRIDNLTVRATTATASRTLLDYTALGLGLRSGVAFTPTYANFTVNGSGITVTLASDLTLAGVLTFTAGNIVTGANTLIITSVGTVSRTSGHVIGNLRKTFASATTLIFQVGTANGYSPVDITATAGTFPANFTVSATQGPHPSVNAATSLQRYWTLTNTTLTSANITFYYLPGDPMGNEAAYKVIRISGGTPVSFPASAVNAGADTATINGVTGFSDWTAGEVVSPTAADGTVSGTILDTAGNPVAGAVVRLSGAQNRKFITDANGYYRFDNVETNEFYVVTPSRVNYSFNPGAMSCTQLGESTQALFTGVPNGQTANPLDTPEYFVRQHYLDFLGREPDEAGFNFWSDQILACGGDVACSERRIINVSAAYFLSVEFQRTGGLVDRLYRAGFGRNPSYAEFVPDRSVIARDLIVGKTGWEQTLSSNEQGFVDDFVNRAAFRTAYDGLTNAEYIDRLVANTGVSFTSAERNALVRGLSSGTLSRAEALHQIAADDDFAKARFNAAFVMMEYFGYLRRDPDEAGYDFWLNKLNQFDGNFEQAEMVKAFINSGEYRARFAR